MKHNIENLSTLFRLIISKSVKPAKDREKTRQTYESAMKDVEDGMPVSRAAKQWAAGKGKIPTLTVAEESKLADSLVERSKRGFGLSVDEFLDSVQTFIQKDKRKTPFKASRPGHNWYRGFIKRNPKVRLRNARPLDKKRAKISAAHVNNWFAEYKQFMIETRLDTRPGQIWNCDETGFDL